MNLRPFGYPVRCPACDNSCFSRTFCGKQCIRAYSSSGSGFIETTRFGDIIEPHLHHECVNCHFTWLEHVANPEALQEVS